MFKNYHWIPMFTIAALVATLATGQSYGQTQNLQKIEIPVEKPKLVIPTQSTDTESEKTVPKISSNTDLILNPSQIKLPVIDLSNIPPLLGTIIDKDRNTPDLSDGQINKDKDSETTAKSLTAIVDVNLKPAQKSLTAFKDGDQERPLATTKYNGRQDSGFVSDELLLATDKKSVLDDFLARWKGVILSTNNPSEGDFNPTPLYLVRINTSLADTSRFSEILKTVAPKARGTLSISSKQGLELITAAATEQVAGLKVDINWVMTPDTFTDRDSVEGNSSNAFNYSYMKTGGAQNTGVAEAWLALERSGKLGNKVTVAVIDAGFAINADFPVGGSYYARNGGLLIGV